MIKGEPSLVQLKDDVVSVSLWFALHLVPFFMIFVSNYKLGTHMVGIDYPKSQNNQSLPMPRLNLKGWHDPKWNSQFQVYLVSLKNTYVLNRISFFLFWNLSRTKIVHRFQLPDYEIPKTNSPLHFDTKRSHLQRHIQQFPYFKDHNFPPLISMINSTKNLSGDKFDRSSRNVSLKTGSLS